MAKIYAFVYAWKISVRIDGSYEVFTDIVNNEYAFLWDN